MLPEGWAQRTVADICEMQNGHGFGPEDWVKEGLPIIRIQNLNGGQKFDFYSGPTEPRWVVEPGQLLFAWAGTKGVSFGPTVWRGQAGVLNQHIFKVQAKDGVDSGWLYWALRQVTDRIEGSAHGFKSTLVHVKKSDIDRQVVIVPPLDEQRRIAQMLLAWDEALTKSLDLQGSLECQHSVVVAALMSGRKRFGPQTTWRSTAISDLIRESRVSGSGGHLAKKLTVRLYGRGVIPKNEKRPGSESTRYYRRSAGQFIYSKLDFLNGAFGIVPDDLDGYESTLDLPAFDFTSGVNPLWFLSFVSREDFYKGHLGLANGGRKARRVNPDDLLRIRVDLPPLEEQEAIARAILDSERLCEAARRHTVLLQMERSALMAELLGGIRRSRARDEGRVS